MNVTVSIAFVLSWSRATTGVWSSWHWHVASNFNSSWTMGPASKRKSSAGEGGSAVKVKKVKDEPLMDREKRWLSHASLRQLSFETGWHLDWSYHTDWQPVHLPCHANLQSSELSPDAGLRSATLETHKTLDAFYDSTFGTKDWALSFSVGIVLSCYIDCIRRKSVSSWAGLTKLSHQSLLCQALKSVASDSLGEIVGSLQSYVFQGPMQALPIWTGKAQFAWDHGNCLGSQNVGSRAWQSRPPVSVLFWGFIWWQLRIGKSQ